MMVYGLLLLALLLVMTENHAQQRKPSRHAWTWPPIMACAFHSLHQCVEISNVLTYIDPRPSSTLLPWTRSYNCKDRSSLHFTFPLPFSDLPAESSAALWTSGSSALRLIRLPATQPERMYRGAGISLHSRSVATTWVTRLHPILVSWRLAQLHLIQRSVLTLGLVGAATAREPPAPPHPIAVAPPLRAGL